LDESFSSLETWMSHFQASQDLDESFSSLSRLGWVTFKSLKTWSRKTLMRSGKKRNRKPKFEGDWGEKRDENFFSIFFTTRAVVRWIDRTTARVVHVRSRAASSLTCTTFFFCPFSSLFHPFRRHCFPQTKTIFFFCPKTSLTVFLTSTPCSQVSFLFREFIPTSSWLFYPENLVSIFRCSSSTTNPVYVSRVNSLVLVCSLSSHRYSYIHLIFSSRFIDS
jgi:hypothetical protein